MPGKFRKEQKQGCDEKRCGNGCGRCKQRFKKAAEEIANKKRGNRSHDKGKDKNHIRVPGFQRRFFAELPEAQQNVFDFFPKKHEERQDGPQVEHHVNQKLGFFKP